MSPWGSRILWWSLKTHIFWLFDRRRSAFRVITQGLDIFLHHQFSVKIKITAAEPERQPFPRVHQLSLKREDKDIWIIVCETFLKHKIRDEDEDEEEEEVDKMFASNSGIPLLLACPA